MPKKGYGQAKKLSLQLRVSSNFVSQVLKGEKSFSADQALEVCEFFGFSEMETHYFLLLHQLDRAATIKLKNHLKKEIEKCRAEAKKISSRLDVTKQLSDPDKMIFYSDWRYSAMRLLLDIPGQSLDGIAATLGLTRKDANDILRFLLTSGLVVEENGKLKGGPSRTHLEADSPFIKLHHQNWRQRALENMRSSESQRLHYSAPMTIGVADVDKVRQRLLKCIEDVGKIIDPAPEEVLMCLNMDWFNVV